MKILFFGTPIFAAKSLQYLLDHGILVSAVVTQPDRPKGRSSQLTPSPAKSLAIEAKIPILQPEQASQEDFLQKLAEFKADLFVVVAFGQILPQKLLDIPPLGCINVHASLLPKYRGAAPIHRAIMAGDTETGIAIQKMVRKLDAGDIIAEEGVKIAEEMTFGELEERLIEVAGPLLLRVVKEYEKGIPVSRPQDESAATYASKIEWEEGEIRWDLPAKELHNRIRAFSPRPGAWAWVQVGGDKKRLKILRSQPVLGRGTPGELLSSEGVIACGKGALRLIDVQPEGKKVMKGVDWLRGQKNILFYN